MMNFMETIKEMKMGKKVKRKSWDITEYIRQHRRQAIDKYHNIHPFTFDDIEATDWEVVEDISTLTSEIQAYCKTNNFPFHYFQYLLGKHRDKIFKELEVGGWRNAKTIVNRRFGETHDN